MSISMYLLLVCQMLTLISKTFTNMSSIAIPGQALLVPEGYLRGHGTFVSLSDKELHSSVAGTIERVNKLVSVRPFKVRRLL